MTQTNLEKAHATRDSIRAKLDDARGALETLDGRRKELAFEAHANGGAALKELQGLDKHRASTTAEIESLEIGVIDASRRIDDAAREAELEADAEKAARARVLEKEATKLMAGMDKDLRRSPSSPIA